METKKNQEKKRKLQMQYAAKFKYSKNFVDLTLSKIIQESMEEQLSVGSVRLADLGLSLALDNKRQFKLPTLEFKKFGGDIEDRLPIWGILKISTNMKTLTMMTNSST